MSKIEKAIELFGGGYNCAQAVLGAFCDDYGLDTDTALRVAGGLGSGVRNAEICGAVSGAVLVIGLKYGHDKALCNTKTEEFTAKFKKENQSIVCKDILKCNIATPDGRNKAVGENLFKTVCMDMVKSAVLILEDLGY